MRFQVTLPLKGEARVIQRFVQEAMLAQPMLAFDSIAFKRDKVETQFVEAKIQLTLILRAGILVKPLSSAAPAVPTT